jgi:hypothetical protein
MWNHLCLISFSYCAGKWTGVFDIGCSVKFPCPAYPVLEASRGASIIAEVIITENIDIKI